MKQEKSKVLSVCEFMEKFASKREVVNRNSFFQAVS